MRARYTGTNPIARWVSVFALVALLAMAALSSQPNRGAVIAADTMHRSAAWHG